MSTTLRWWRCWLAALVVLLGGGAALGQSPCGAEVAPWLAACQASQGLRLQVERCTPERLVVQLAPEQAPPFSVELRARAEGAFVAAGDLGLSPIGEYPNWLAEPEGRRVALQRLTRCVAETPPGFLHREAGEPRRSAEPAGRRGEAAQRGSSGQASSPPPLPWPLLVVLALLLAALAVELLAPPRARPRRVLTTLGGAGGAAALLGLARWALFPAGYAHQNGQGPLWVRYALQGDDGLRDYGPGFRELFGGLALLAPTPEQGVFGLQAALSSLAVVGLALAARRLGAPKWAAGAFGVLLGLDPALARIAQSESYWATAIALQALAATALLWGAYAERGVLRPLVGSALAGVLVAVAARVHPVGWVPSALLPLLVLLAPLPPRRRWRLVLLAAAVMGALTALLAGGVLWDVVHSEFGQRWTGAARSRPFSWGEQLASVTASLELALLGLAGLGLVEARRAGRRGRWALGVALLCSVALLAGKALDGTARGRLATLPSMPLSELLALAYSPAVVLAVALGLVGLGLWRRRSRLLLAGLSLGLVVLVVERTELLGAAPSRLILAAALRLYLPLTALVLIGAARELTAGLTPARRGAGVWLAALGLGAVWSWSEAQPILREPTDVQEARAVMGWRSTALPEGAVVYTVLRHGQRLAIPPLFGAPPWSTSLRGLAADQSVPQLPEHSYYLRSSLCSTLEVQAYCAALERDQRLIPVARVELPARPSMASLPYAVERVEVVLYRVGPR